MSAEAGTATATLAELRAAYHEAWCEPQRKHVTGDAEHQPGNPDRTCGWEAEAEMREFLRAAAHPAVDMLRCGQCGDDLLPEHIEGHLNAEGRTLLAGTLDEAWATLQREIEALPVSYVTGYSDKADVSLDDVLAIVDRLAPPPGSWSAQDPLRTEAGKRLLDDIGKAQGWSRMGDSESFLVTTQDAHINPTAVLSAIKEIEQQAAALPQDEPGLRGALEEAYDLCVAGAEWAEVMGALARALHPSEEGAAPPGDGE